MLAKHTNVLVRRDMAEIINCQVFEHEVEILRDMHGDANIEEIGGDFAPVEIDASEEFDRLANVYGRNDEGQMYVERVIGRGPKQLEVLGYKKPGRKAAAVTEEVSA